jgi:hypothetical protein
MKRRPRLDLSSGKNANKKQPAGLDAEEPRPAGNPQGETGNEARAREWSSRRFAAAGSSCAPGETGWPFSGRFAKILVVTAAAALSVYLLKRRFF